MAWKFLDDHTLQFNNNFQIQLLKGNWHSPQELFPKFQEDISPEQIEPLLREGLEFAISVKKISKRRSQFGRSNVRPDRNQIELAIEQTMELIAKGKAQPKKSLSQQPKIITKRVINKKIDRVPVKVDSDNAAQEARPTLRLRSKSTNMFEQA